MLDPRKVPLPRLFFTFLIFALAIPSTTSTATRVAVKSEASMTTPTVAAVVSRDQVTCTMCAECDNPCQPVPSPPPPPPVVECPPPPSPPPPSPPPPVLECPPPPMPPACSVCESPETGSVSASPPPPATSGTPVPYFPYYYDNFPQNSGASSSLHLEMKAAGFATSLALGGFLYVLRF